MVHRDHHIELAKGYYSVAYELIGQRVDVRLGARVVEIFSVGAVVAAHARVERAYHRRTIDAHRPPEHRAYLALGFDQMLDQATKIGPNTAAVYYSIKHCGGSTSGRRSVRHRGILRLAVDFSAAALEHAAAKALDLKVYSYRVRCVPSSRSPSLTATHPNRRRRHLPRM